jgi:hypothetical protein
MKLFSIRRVALVALLAALPALIVFDVRSMTEYALMSLGVR